PGRSARSGQAEVGRPHGQGARIVRPGRRRLAGDDGEPGPEPLLPEASVRLGQPRVAPALTEDPERLLAELVALGPREQPTEELGLLPGVDVPLVLGRPPAVDATAPGGGEVPRFLVEGGGAL